MSLATFGVQVVSAAIAAGALTVAVSWWRGRRSAPVDNAVKLTDASIKMMENMAHQVAEAQQDAQEARRDLAEARREMADARRLASGMRRDMQSLADRLHRLAELVHDPYMTLDRLREMIPLPTESETG